MVYSFEDRSDRTLTHLTSKRHVDHPQDVLAHAQDKNVVQADISESSEYVSKHGRGDLGEVEDEDDEESAEEEKSHLLTITER